MNIGSIMRMNERRMGRLRIWILMGKRPERRICSLLRGSPRGRGCTLLLRVLDIRNSRGAFERCLALTRSDV
jgi:hypothetical protein